MLFLAARDVRHDPDCCPTGPPEKKECGLRSSHPQTDAGSPGSCAREPAFVCGEILGRSRGGPPLLTTIRAHVCLSIRDSSSCTPCGARISPRSQVSQRGRFHDHIWPLRLTDDD
jgi:hypothetical protein